MAEEVNLEVNVKAGKGTKAVKDVRKELVKAKNEAKDVSKAISSQGEVAKTVKVRLRELQDEMAEIGDVGNPTFQKLAKEAGALKDQMNNANQAIKTMSSDFPKLQIGIQALQSLGGASQIATSAQALLGTENEAITKSIQKMMAVQGLMNGVQSIANLLSDESALGLKIRTIRKKLFTKATLQQAVATKTATTTQKIFNAVMKANPIGLIITGITLLVGALVLLGKNVKKVGDFFTWLGDIMTGALSGVLMFFGVTDQAIETQSMKERKAFEEKTRQQKEIAKQNQDRIDDIKGLAKTRREAFAEQNEIFDLEIARMEAEGKNANALKRAKIEAILEEERAELETINNLIASWTKYYEDLFAMSGKSREDFIAQLKGQGIDVELLQQQALDLVEEQNRKIFQAETNLIAFERNLRKKANTEKVKEEKKTNQKIVDERGKLIEQIEKLENEYHDSFLTKQQQEENAVRDKYFNLIEEAKQYHLDTLILEEAQAEALKEIEDRFAEEKKVKEDEERLERIAKIEEDANKVIDSAEAVADIVGSLNTIFHGKELKRIQEKQDRGEKLTASEERRIKKEAKLQKALALVQIATDTARAIAGAVAAGASIPFPGNIPAIISGVGAVLANVASASQVLGEAIDIPSTPASAVDSVSDVGSDVPDTRSLESGSTLTTEPTQQPVLVVESMTDGINSVEVIEAQATFG
jgi:hypothetical protein